MTRHAHDARHDQEEMITRFDTLSSMLELKNVSVVKGGRTILTRVNLRVDPGELVTIVGKSGSGKTTLLELFTGLTLPSDGIVEVDGVDLREIPKEALQLYRRRVGVVFEDGKLLPLRTVAENVAFPLEVTGAPDGAIEKRVELALRSVGLTEHADDLPEHLTADERLRTAIARATVHQPLIVLADEPTATLDANEAASVLALFKEIYNRGSTVVVFTHDASLAAKLGGRVIELAEDLSAAPSPKPVVRKKPDIVAVTPPPARPKPVVSEAPVPVKTSTPEPEAKPASVSVSTEEDDAKNGSASSNTKAARKIRVTSIHSD